MIDRQDYHRCCHCNWKLHCLYIQKQTTVWISQAIFIDAPLRESIRYTVLKSPSAPLTTNQRPTIALSRSLLPSSPFQIRPQSKQPYRKLGTNAEVPSLRTRIVRKWIRYGGICNSKYTFIWPVTDLTSFQCGCLPQKVNSKVGFRRVGTALMTDRAVQRVQCQRR